MVILVAYDYPVLQLISTMIINFGYVAFIMSRRIFSSLKEQRIEVANEVVVVFSLDLISCFLTTDFIAEQEIRAKASLALLGLICFNFLITILVVLYDLRLALKQCCTRRRSKIHNQKKLEREIELTRMRKRDIIVVRTHSNQLQHRATESKKRLSESVLEPVSESQHEEEEEKGPGSGDSSGAVSYYEKGVNAELRQEQSSEQFTRLHIYQQSSSLNGLQSMWDEAEASQLSHVIMENEPFEDVLERGSSPEASSRYSIDNTVAQNEIVEQVESIMLNQNHKIKQNAASIVSIRRRETIKGDLGADEEISTSFLVELQRWFDKQKVILKSK